MSDWIKCTNELPPDGLAVATKIDDANGCRNEQSLRRRGNLWWTTDDKMYVYYTPTHWSPISTLELQHIRQGAPTTPLTKR